MRNLSTFKITLSALSLLLFAAPEAKAEGEYAWPANYSGVMLQGFYWDSYSESKWTNLTASAAELSAYFDLIWVPNSGKASSSPSMGYNPCYWFTPNHNSSFGTETELRKMISTFNDFGTGIIEDVVVNHRAGATNWYDFPTETYKGVTYSLGLSDICCNDEMAYTSGQPTPTGNYDTGDNFDGYRDLDHTSTNVQNAVKAYLDCLKNDFGYIGWRYDMVKGFGATYVEMYNRSAQCSYSVGEYWDSYDNITNWIEGTNRQSAAFDFPFKWAMNDAFNNTDFTNLVWARNYTLNQPAGLIHMDTYQRYAVTFIDNHDTYNDDSYRFTGDIAAANAFMLMMPGTPCVCYAHWLNYKDDIKTLISIRKSVGITNQSTVTIVESTKNRVVAEVTGTNGKALIKVGRGSYTPSDYTTSDRKASNSYYSIWTKVDITDLGDNVAQLSFSPEAGTYSGGTTVTITITNASNFTNPVVIYTTDGTDPSLENGTQAASGVQIPVTSSIKLKAVAAANGKIVSDIKEGNYLTQAEDIDVYVKKPDSWSKINIYAWISSEILDSWPGTAMTNTVTINGETWYNYNFGSSYDYVNVIFNNGTAQTVDIENVEFGKHYFTLNSDTGTAITVTETTDEGGVGTITASDDVTVYPNPATDVVRVKSGKEVASISIYSISGALAAQSAGADNVSVAGLDKGLYLYTVIFADGSTAKGKLLKK